MNNTINEIAEDDYLNGAIPQPNTSEERNTIMQMVNLLKQLKSNTPEYKSMVEEFNEYLTAIGLAPIEHYLKQVSNIGNNMQALVQ